MNFVGLESLYHSFSLIATQRAERSVAAGANVSKVSLYQTIEALVAARLANLAFVAVGMPPCSWGLTSVIALTPLLIGDAKVNDRLGKQLQPLWTFLYSHIHLLCQVVAVIATVSLIFTGHSVSGLISLSVLLLAHLDQSGYLPEKARQWLHAADTPTSSLLGIFLEPWKTFKVLAGLNLMSWGVRQVPQKPENVASHQLTLKMAQQILDNNQTLVLNEAYIKEQLHLKDPPPTDYKKIVLDLFDHTNWKQQIDVLKIKLQDNERFQLKLKEQGLSLGELSDDACIQKTRESLEGFLVETQNHKILDGEIKDYALLEAYLSWIAIQCQKKIQDPQEVTNYLLLLAIDCGHNCGVRRFEYAEELYFNLLSEEEDTSFRDKILYHLQNLRERTFKTVYHNGFYQWKDYFPFKYFFPGDLHSFNFIKNGYGREFGLRLKAVENDETVQGFPLGETIYSYLLKPAFLRLHTPDAMTQELYELIPTNSLPTAHFFQFWAEWIERQDISRSEKDELSRNLTDNNSFLGLEALTDPENGKANYFLLQLMLVDMGILQIK